MQRSDPSLDSLTSELQLGGSRPFPWIIVAALVAGLSVSAAVGWVKFALPSTAQDRRAKAIAELAGGQKEFEAFANAARARAAWTSTAAALKAIQDTQETAFASAAELESLLASLIESEQGRGIAARPEMVAQFVALRDRKRLSKGELEAIGRSLKEIQRINDLALADETLLIDVDQNVVAQIEEIDGQRSQFIELSQDLASLRLLMEQAEGNSPTDSSLAQAVEAWERERNEAQLAELAEAQALLQSELAQRRQVQTLEAERRDEEAQLQATAADESISTMLAEARTEKEKEIIRQAEAQLAAVRARYQLERELQQALPEIKSLLSPMVSHGKKQIGGDPLSWYDGEVGPLSLAQIKRFGALKPNNEVLLATLFCGPNNVNDRPYGSFPERVPYNDGKFKRAQDLLIKFGDLMVEKGLLSP